MRATAWRMRREAVALPSGIVDRPAARAARGGRAAGRLRGLDRSVAYHRAFDWRWVEGGFTEPGPATAWARLEVELAAGERVTRCSA